MQYGKFVYVHAHNRECFIELDIEYESSKTCVLFSEIRDHQFPRISRINISHQQVHSIPPLILICNVDLYASNSSSGSCWSQTASNHWNPNCKSCVNILSFLTLLPIQPSQSIAELSKFNWEVGGINNEVISSLRYVFRIP